MEYFNVCSQITYTDKSGKELKRYYRAGTLKVTPSGAMYLRLFTQPSVEFHCFKQEQIESPELPVIDADK